MTPEQQLFLAVERAEEFNALTISVVLVEIHRINEIRGLSENEMEFFADKLNNLCDEIENFQETFKDQAENS